MKRALLITGGTIAGLGGVLAITPPQFGHTTSLSGGSLAGGSSMTTTSTTTTPAQSQAPATTPATTAAATQAPATTPATTAATKKATKKATAKKTSAATTTKTTTTTATTTTTTSKAAAPSGTFAGSTAQTQFGPVQVEITVANGKITSAKALQYPTNSFRDQQINSQAIPYLIQETVQANGSNIQGVGGASYTSQGWYDSLVSAIAKADPSHAYLK
jgi:uncharacterized protein with FMN-binding domain